MRRFSSGALGEAHGVLINLHLLRRRARARAGETGYATERDNLMRGLGVGARDLQQVSCRYRVGPIGEDMHCRVLHIGIGGFGVGADCIQRRSATRIFQQAKEDALCRRIGSGQGSQDGRGPHRFIGQGVDDSAHRIRDAVALRVIFVGRHQVDQVGQNLDIA